jgi:hypothetical protein
LPVNDPGLTFAGKASLCRHKFDRLFFQAHCMRLEKWSHLKKGPTLLRRPFRGDTRHAYQACRRSMTWVIVFRSTGQGGV